jgi:hypothetical protein
MEILGGNRMRASTHKVITAPKSENRRIFVATGITGLVRAEWAMARWNQIAPCNWSKTEYLMWLDQYAPLGFLVAEARNVAVQTFLEHGFEWLIFIDHDTVLPPHFLVTVNERIIKERVPVWSGLYFTKSTPAEPLVFRGLGNGYFADWKMGDKVWVSGVPMGCTVIHRSIMQAVWDESEEYECNGMKMRRVFETPIRMWEDPKTQSWQTSVGTEDLHWCDKVVKNGIFRKAGWPEYQRKTYPFLVDTNVFCTHIDASGNRYPSQGEEKFFQRDGKRSKNLRD